MVGTLLYSSPEQSRGQPATKASDVFSMGLTLYKVITGESVYDNIDEVDSTSGQEVMMYLGSLIHSGAELELQFPETVPAPVQEVIRRACRVHQEDRYPDARAMYFALNDALGAFVPGPARSRVWPSILFAVIALALAAGVAGYWWTTRETKPEVLEVQREAEPRALETLREAESATPELAPEVEPEPEVVPEPALAVTPSTPWEAPDDEQRTQAMLRRADQQFAANRLTLPAGDNALESYRAILAIDPANPRARAGVEAIRLREVEFAEKAELQSNLPEALSYYRRALLAVPEDREVTRRMGVLDARIASQREEQRLASQLEAERSEALSERPEPQLANRTLGRSNSQTSSMVSVEAGSFSMGKGEGTPASTAAFSIDRTEVTSRAYNECVSAGACTLTRRGRGCNLGQPEREEHPVNCVNFAQAKAYCEWAGKRIPTAAEWEKAARGTSGQTYPWGEETPSCDLQVMRARDCRTTSTAPVGSLPVGASPYGALDMMGNVWEWTEGTDAGRPILRGGAWNTGVVSADHLYPYEAKSGTPSTGFRCVR
jgi:formylglycine-generating enzyme required for sulfatase activity